DETVRNGPPSRDDFPVQLQGDGTCTVIRAREVHDYFPARAEAGVECAIGIIARQREVGWAVNIGLTRRNHLPVWLDRDPTRPVTVNGASELGDHLSSCAEAWVKRAATLGFDHRGGKHYG